ncbi:MAG: peptidylprolyl isomerase [Gemmatimonadota bacterium]
MAQASNGDKVSIHYTGRLDDGTVFDTSENREPLGFELGSGQVIPGFEDAVRGMEPGQKQTVTIAAENAYGPRRDDLVMSFPREQLPDGVNPEPGQQLQMQTQEGQAVQVTVRDATEDALILDANHPLAGQDLTFEIELVEVG